MGGAVEEPMRERGYVVYARGEVYRSRAKSLVPVVIRLVGAVNRETKVVRLDGREGGGLDVELGEMG